MGEGPADPLVCTEREGLRDFGPSGADVPRGALDLRVLQQLLDALGRGHRAWSAPGPCLSPTGLS